MELAQNSNRGPHGPPRLSERRSRLFFTKSQFNHHPILMHLQDGIGSVRMTRAVLDAAAGIRNRNNSEETTMRLSSLTLIVLGVFLSPAVFSGEYPSTD